MEKKLIKERNTLLIRIMLILFAVWLFVSVTYCAVRLYNEESSVKDREISNLTNYQISLNYRALHMKKELTFIDENGMQHTNEKANANNPDHMAYLQKGNANGEREMLVQVLKHRTDLRE